MRKDAKYPVSGKNKFMEFLWYTLVQKYEILKVLNIPNECGLNFKTTKCRTTEIS